MSDKPVALITGISGQDGHYLTHELLQHGRKVVGFDLTEYPIGDIPSEEVEIFVGDLKDAACVEAAVEASMPSEIYNLAALTYVGSSWDEAASVIDANATGVLNVLEAAKKFVPNCRIYQASTSEMFGNIGTEPQDEVTPMMPVSPYGAAKLMAHHLCRIYRESYGMFVACGIGFNHESPIRPERFVTRKVTAGVAKIFKGIAEASDWQPIYLGNVDSFRDWSHAADIATAMRMMLEADEPDDFVIASGVSHSVRDLCDFAFRAIGYELAWGQDDCGVYAMTSDGVLVVRSTSDNMRPNDLVYLRGDSTKIKNKLGWEPGFSFEDLITEMVHTDLQLLGIMPNDANTSSLV